jgi:hypothetical protein
VPVLGALDVEGRVVGSGPATDRACVICSRLSLANTLGSCCSRWFSPTAKFGFSRVSLAPIWGNRPGTYRLPQSPCSVPRPRIARELREQFWSKSSKMWRSQDDVGRAIHVGRCGACGERIDCDRAGTVPPGSSHASGRATAPRQDRCHRHAGLRVQWSRMTSGPARRVAASSVHRTSWVSRRPLPGSTSAKPMGEHLRTTGGGHV